MHCQMYDVEEEFEPRVTPKPTTKLDHFAVPSVPEVSLIFEKPTQARNLNDGDISSSSARIARPVQRFDKSIEHNHINIISPNSGNRNLHTVNPTSPNSGNHDSYTAWKEKVYSRENNYVNTARVSSPCKNVYTYNRALQTNVQDDTVQKQQEQSKNCDTQNRLINLRPNDRIHEKNVKFRCSNTENSPPRHVRETELLSSDKRQLLSCNPLQGATHLTDSAMIMPSNAFVGALKQNEHLQMPYPPCPYPFQQFYTPSYSNRDIDNNETVKTLLQLVNNQNEQIKTLQLQVDRLVRLQEESFRNKSTCACSSSHANQVFGYSAINCTNTCTQSSNQAVKQNAAQSPSVTENKPPESLVGDKDNSKLDVALLEQQPKKAFMEQKVSIGVMTSFEFTVQNNPFLVDSEVYKEKETSAEESNDINRRSAVNMHDTSESVKRYKNTFTRKPGTAQLENIVEDTESYLSSSHQQSSNFNASSSVRDSERHTPKQPDLYNTNNTSESPRIYRRLSADPNEENMREREIYMKKGGNMVEQAQSTRIITNTSRDVGSPKNADCDKAFVVNDAHNYTAMDKGSNNERTNVNRYNSHNVHLPATNYYQSHRNKESDANVKEARDVGDSVILSGGDLEIVERPPPTPEPSIHVNMQEYPSDDESDKLKCTSKIGWTFYNNVLGQVNAILQNSSVIEDKEHREAKATRRVEQEADDTEARPALNTVKATTLEQLRKLGISITDNEHRESNGNNKTLDFDSSYYPRLDRQANMMHATSVVNETNTSMHMKALALKYLGDDELTDIALHKQGSSSLKHLMLSNMQGTNMSFATMRYLERYQLLPGRNQDVQTENTSQVYAEVASKRDFQPTTGKKKPALHQFPFVQTPGTTFSICFNKKKCFVLFQELCRNNCSRPVGEFELYPEINEEAGANISLHCKGTNTLMIKHNPGIYVIEQSASNDTWNATTVSVNGLSTFFNLTASTFYRYRLHRVTQRGVSFAETSNWFSTHAVDYQPRAVEHISLLKIEVESKDACKLQAEIVFKPAKDRSCNYNILSWSGEHNLINFDVEKILDFRFFLRNLRYNQNNTVTIVSGNDDFSKISNKTTFTFFTPSCLEVHTNLSICAPEVVKGLRVEHIQKRKGSYDIKVSWNKPALQPDNYTLQIDSFQFEPRLLVVPGNVVEALFLNVDVGPRYDIGIVAESAGGVSLLSSISESIDEEIPELSHREIIVALPTLIIIVVVFGAICMQRRNKKNKKTNMRYVHFEDFTDSLKKPLKQDYAVENGETLLSRDKFEISPQQLKLKDVLGSGAYGIVRLATLQDEFGTVTDVAVKMMKDDPTVEDIKSFHQEISMMKSAGQHPNIVSLIGYCTLYNKPLLVVEYCSKGDLQTYLRTIWQNLVNAVFERRTRLQFVPMTFVNKGTDQGKSDPYCKKVRTIVNRLYDIQQDVIKYTENVTCADLLNFARQVATGMEFLSSNRIVHRDLAARNVLVRPDRVVKISDFGLSRDIYQENVYRKKGNGKLPLKWMAIEALTHQIYTTYSDVWAFGILLWEIVTLGAMPYPSTPTNRILQLLKSGYRMERPPNCGRELYNIMYSCWNLRPQSRPTFTELKQSLDKLLSNYSENKYLNLSEVLQESTDESNEPRSINAC
ncbi:uncharacterized protein LOC116846385 [Odontomachus brunneus]|uniref:uncharacterized protein LOC116846385 n=1 Tax=Odontomachus brunneus TaxID=486640 RepID=UPI0013F1EBE2|nr:uncharacterized protein LOC116846385 [Odontomachus brunneus]